MFSITIYIMKNIINSFVDITRFRKTRLILFSVFVLFINTAVFSETEAPVFTHELHTTKFIPKRTPESDFGDRIKKEVEALDANSGSEMLYSFDLNSFDPNPEPYEPKREKNPKTKKNFLEGLSDEELDLIIMQTLLSVDSQKGIQYYSNSNKEYRTFFTDIYRIESVKSTRSLENLEIDSLQDSVSTFLSTKDNSYGKLVFSYDIYYDRTHTFYLTLANQVRAYYKSIFFVGPPKALNTQYIVQRDGSKISVYGIAFSKILIPFKGIRVSASKSTLYRMFSVAQWLERELRKNLDLLYTQSNKPRQ